VELAGYSWRICRLRLYWIRFNTNTEWVRGQLGYLIDHIRISGIVLPRVANLYWQWHGRTPNLDRVGWAQFRIRLYKLSISTSNCEAGRRLSITCYQASTLHVKVNDDAIGVATNTLGSWSTPRGIWLSIRGRHGPLREPLTNRALVTWVDVISVTNINRGDHTGVGR
jgi:hypothetical protein